MVCLNALTRHLQPQVIQARERAQIRAIKGSIGHVEVFQMDGVGTPIIERPRPLPGHDTPNPTHHTLNYEEPPILGHAGGGVHFPGPFGTRPWPVFGVCAGWLWADLSDQWRHSPNRIEMD